MAIVRGAKMSVESFRKAFVESGFVPRAGHLEQFRQPLDEDGTSTFSYDIAEVGTLRDDFYLTEEFLGQAEKFFARRISSS